jgi:hypothetical protein
LVFIAFESWLCDFWLGLLMGLLFLERLYIWELKFVGFLKISAPSCKFFSNIRFSLLFYFIFYLLGLIMGLNSLFLITNGFDVLLTDFTCGGSIFLFLEVSKTPRYVIFKNSIFLFSFASFHVSLLELGMVLLEYASMLIALNWVRNLG